MGSARDGAQVFGRSGRLLDAFAGSVVFFFFTAEGRRHARRSKLQVAQEGQVGRREFKRLNIVKCQSWQKAYVVSDSVFESMSHATTISNSSWTENR